LKDMRAQHLGGRRKEIRPTGRDKLSADEGRGVTKSRTRKQCAAREKGWGRKGDELIVVLALGGQAGKLEEETLGSDRLRIDFGWTWRASSQCSHSAV